MGSRPSGFKRGGGFLNNVDGLWSDYNFTTTPEAFDTNNKKNKKGKKDDDDDFSALYAELTFAIDGADGPQTTTVFAGNAADFEISEDGKSLTPNEEGAGLYGGKPFHKFIESLVLAGFPESNFPDDEEPINYEAALGTRLRLTQRVDAEATARLGKKKSKDKKKEYDRTDLVVEKVYALPGESKSAGKSANKPKAGKGGKKEFDLDEASAEVLRALLADAKDNTLQKASLPNLLVKALKKDNPNREDIRRRVYSDEFLETQDGWEYDASSKKQLIELVSSDDDE